MKTTLSVFSAFAMLALFMFLGISSCKRDSPNDPALQLISFSPGEGSAGGAVTLTGKNFSSVKERNIVRFNGAEAIVSEAMTDGSSITVIIPDNASTGKISVKVGLQEVVSAKDFVVNALALAVRSFSPNKGPEGTVVTITGNNFKAPATVYFGAIEGTDVAVKSSTSIEVKVPANTRTSKIKVKCDEVIAESAMLFYAAPTASGIKPAKASEGAEVEITGTNFDPTPENNIVKFGTVVAEVLYATETKLIVKVPAGASDGKLDITVQGMTTQTIDAFTLLATITDFSPKYGERGTTVVITGKNFDAGTVVKLGTSECKVIKQETNSITVEVNNSVFAVGGYFTVSSKYTTVKSLEEFELTNTWQLIMGSSALKHSQGTIFTINGMIYLMGGTLNSEVHEFDPGAKTWTKVNTMPAEIANGRYGSVTVLNNKAYVGNFYDNSTNGAWFEFNPAIVGASAWKRMTDYPEPVKIGVAFSVKGKLYAGLGRSDQSITTSIYQLDPEANDGSGEWKAKFDPGAPNQRFVSHFVINDVFYFGGGTDLGNNDRSVFYKFDPAVSTSSVTAIEPFGIPISRAPSYALDGKGYIIRNEQPFEYSPGSNTWSMTDHSFPTADISFAIVVNNTAYALTSKGEVYQYIPRR
ncbi:MAG: IPT/TIG domain-containing protein [Chitinophagaceae bacterium]|nr:IPT/TIG domain-containing protein [Chitinophagaceae bacterium]